METNKFSRLVVIAHNIRSAYNIGAIFRTAEGLGVSKIYLTGYTLSPYNKKEGKYPSAGEKSLAKTALGAEDLVKWEKVENVRILIKKLKKERYQIIGLEILPQSLDIKKIKPKFPCALILGNEISGIERDILRLCDKIIFIPMQGQKESFNVSIAAGIALYEILNK